MKKTAYRKGMSIRGEAIEFCCWQVSSSKSLRNSTVMQMLKKTPWYIEFSLSLVADDH
jgi:hypothetical protein